MFGKENTKIDLGKTLVWAYLVLSFIFIVITFYNDFKMQYANSKYNQWYTTAIAQIVQSSSECRAFPVDFGENRVNLINVACLQAPAEGQQQAQAAELENTEQ
jgi:hypothetical protein